MRFPTFSPTRFSDLSPRNRYFLFFSAHASILSLFLFSALPNHNLPSTCPLYPNPVPIILPKIAFYLSSLCTALNTCAILYKHRIWQRKSKTAKKFSILFEKNRHNAWRATYFWRRAALDIFFQTTSDFPSLSCQSLFGQFSGSYSSLRYYSPNSYYSSFLLGFLISITLLCSCILVV